MTYKYDKPIKSRVSTGSDRYAGLMMITDMDTKEKFLETYRRKVIPTSPDDNYHTVELQEEDRLDVIAYNYYQNPMLWWLIASANNIKDPMTNPKPGDILRIPNLQRLYGLGGILL